MRRIRSLAQVPGIVAAMSDDERAEQLRLLSRRKLRTEADLQQACEEALTLAGIWHMHITDYVAVRYMRPGIPDLLCCVGGQFVGLELKTTFGRVTRHQKTEHARIRESGGNVHVIRSVAELLSAVEVNRGPDRGAESEVAPEAQARSGA